jgi:RNA polymerase sigma-70 factor (ECF subfamily)
MLGSISEADDAVQEAWIRLGRTDVSEVENLRGWLTTVVARVCLDMLRTRASRQEESLDVHVPDPIVTSLPDHASAGPEADAMLADSVGVALLVVLEQLEPAERLAFVLHDVFGMSFDEIAPIVDRTPAAARQLASRGRRAVSDSTIRHHADLAEQRRVLAAFLTAAERGDLDALVAVLAPDVVAIGDGGGVAPAGRHPVHRAVQVARFMAGLFRQARKGPALAELVLVNGDLGLLVEATYPDGRPIVFVMAFAYADGRITAILNQLNPAKLRRVPAPDRSRSQLRWSPAEPEPR